MPGLGSEGEDVELGGGRKRAKRYFPFAEGPRHCVGMSLANITLPATLAVLLSRYSFKLADEVRLSHGQFCYGPHVLSGRDPATAELHAMLLVLLLCFVS